MKRSHSWTSALLLALAVAGSSLALPLLPQDKKKDDQQKTDQQKTDQQKTDDQKKQQQQQPAPLFAGKGGLKSSRQGKDSATLGFSGVGPNGEIEQAVLNASPSGTDMQKAYEMGNRKVGPDALELFIMEGQLNPQGAAKSTK
jgi:hypothetical protein